MKTNIRALTPESVEELRKVCVSNQKPQDEAPEPILTLDQLMELRPQVEALEQNRAELARLQRQREIDRGLEALQEKIEKVLSGEYKYHRNNRFIDLITCLAEAASRGESFVDTGFILFDSSDTDLAQYYGITTRDIEFLREIQHAVVIPLDLDTIDPALYTPNPDDPKKSDKFNFYGIVLLFHALESLNLKPVVVIEPREYNQRKVTLGIFLL